MLFTARILPIALPLAFGLGWMALAPQESTPALLASIPTGGSDAVAALTTAPSPKTSIAPGNPASTSVAPLPPDFVATLHRAGLTPQSFAAAAVPAAAVLTCLQAAADAINANPQALANADLALAQARQQRDTWQRIIRSGLAGAQATESFQTASNAWNAALAARDSLLTNYHQAAVASLSAAQRTALAHIRAQHDWHLPPIYAVNARSAAQWSALRDALAWERSAEEFGELDQASAQTTLEAVRAEPQVIAAVQSSNQHLAQLELAWNSALGH